MFNSFSPDHHFPWAAVKIVYPISLNPTVCHNCPMKVILWGLPHFQTHQNIVYPASKLPIFDYFWPVKSMKSLFVCAEM
jgi:hypothetical protein